VVEAGWVRVALRVATWVILGFLYLPLVVVAIHAFNESGFMAWPPTGFTLRWFGEAIENSAIPEAFVNSILAALGAVAIALVLGTLAAMAVQRYSFFGRDTISFLLLLPIALPGVITGIALSNVVARLRRLPRSSEEASSDLGADTWITFRRITTPAMRTALLSGALLAFALSFDEVIVTLFTAGAGTQTIPLFVLAAMQRPTELPVVNVVALVLILFSVIPVYIAQRISGDVAGGGRY
jgi:putative spermidine/putrescine transport system permease protein